jgi:hypothetical protein
LKLLLSEYTYDSVTGKLNPFSGGREQLTFGNIAAIRRDRDACFSPDGGGARRMNPPIGAGSARLEKQAKLQVKLFGKSLLGPFIKT